jgi:hypothetical protein
MSDHGPNTPHNTLIPWKFRRPTVIDNSTPLVFLEVLLEGEGKVPSAKVHTSSAPSQWKPHEQAAQPASVQRTGTL